MHKHIKILHWPSYVAKMCGYIYRYANLFELIYLVDIN